MPAAAARTGPVLPQRQPEERALPASPGQAGPGRAVSETPAGPRRDPGGTPAGPRRDPGGAGGAGGRELGAGGRELPGGRAGGFMIPKDLAYQGPGCARPCAIMKPGRDEERGRQAPGSRTHYRFRSAPGQASTHLSSAMAELIAARDWLTAVAPACEAGADRYLCRARTR